MKNKYMNDELFNELVTSMKEGASIMKGETEPSRKFEYTPLNVKQIRERSHKSQNDFARMIGVKVGTLKNWEQGRRTPAGAALSLLKLVDADPEYVAKILHM